MWGVGTIKEDYLGYVLYRGWIMSFTRPRTDFIATDVCKSRRLLGSHLQKAETPTYQTLGIAAPVTMTGRNG